MIDNTQQNNVKISLEQLQQLEVFETRSNNLQIEIKTSTKFLSALVNDTTRITKEKEYQETLLSEISSKVLAKQTELDSINEQILTAISTRESITQHNAVAVSINSSKDMALKEREDNVAKSEIDCVAQRTNLSKEKEVFELEREVFENKVKRLKEVISEI